MNKLARRTCLAALLLASLPSLQGCFPVIAAGAGATALMAADRRSSGAYVEDQGLELKVGSRIDERFKDRVHVNVTSFNRTVLLTGEAPDASTRAELESIAAGVPNVRSIQNEVQTAGITSMGARTNDSYITSKVKARFIDANKFPAYMVKVVTEAGTVYLMGLVTQQEADDAAQITSTTGGVQKVVRVFEYITPAQARELDRRQQGSTTSTDKG